VIAPEKQRKLVGSGAITDGETDAKNASVDGPLISIFVLKCANCKHCLSLFQTTPKLYEPVFLNIKDTWHTCVVTVPYNTEPEPDNVEKKVTVTYLFLQEDHVPRHDWVLVEDLYPFNTVLKGRTRKNGIDKTLFREYINGFIKEPLAGLLYLGDKRERDVLKLQYYGEKKGHGVVAE
jgi:hypothetical protein